MTGEKLFLNELKEYVNCGMSKNDLKTLINQRLKELERKQVNVTLGSVSVSDSEIDNYATNQAQEYSDFEGEQIEIAENLTEGAKWMRDKIKTH